MRLGSTFGGGRRTSSNQILQTLVSHVMHLTFQTENDKTPLYSKWESDTIRSVLRIVFYRNVGNYIKGRQEQKHGNYGLEQAFVISGHSSGRGQEIGKKKPPLYHLLRGVMDICPGYTKLSKCITFHNSVT